jgi:uncharacterized pyridoxamine 5'-phosphate oxidase family protein
MAKWKLETGEIIVGEVDVCFTDKGKIYYFIFAKIKHIFKNELKDYAPNQQIGAETDFTILLKDGKIIKATFIKDPKELLEYWEQNRVIGFHLNNNLHFDVYHLLDCGGGIIARIP